MDRVVNKKPEGVKFNIRIKLDSSYKSAIYGVLNICVCDYGIYYTLLDYDTYRVLTISNDEISDGIEYVDMFYGRIDG